MHAINFKIIEMHGLTEKFMGRLRMYFSVTLDPFLSIFEVRSVLYACFKVLNKLHLFDKFTQEFDNLMPECTELKNPRKLAHLAACKSGKI